MFLLRTLSACAIGLFLTEALVVDMNGCLPGVGSVVSGIILWGTLVIGMTLASMLLITDRGYRVFHLACVAGYVAMLLPMCLM